MKHDSYCDNLASHRHNGTRRKRAGNREKKGPYDLIVSLSLILLLLLPLTFASENSKVLNGRAYNFALNLIE